MPKENKISYIGWIKGYVLCIFVHMLRILLYVNAFSLGLKAPEGENIIKFERLNNHIVIKKFRTSLDARVRDKSCSRDSAVNRWLL